MRFSIRRRRPLYLVAVICCIVIAFQLSGSLLFENNSIPPTPPKRDIATFSAMKVEMELATLNNKTTVVRCSDRKPSLQDKCSQLSYGSVGDLPSVSVVICFHNSETVSNLLRTIHSLVQRTEDSLLHEIIVIDDFSRKDDLGQTLEIYIRTVFSSKVKFFRNTENMGLIRSRLKGSRIATGDVLFFMDSHAEVLPGWLEPLLFEIKNNRKTLVSSHFDWISRQDDGVWTHRHGCTSVTIIFDYTMGFGWDYIPSEEILRRNETDPVRLKSIIGTFCGIDRNFFQEIGEFDDGMQFWGAENIELALRVWMFGGQVIEVPCSRVAHFEGDGTRSYRIGFDSIIHKNYKRMAEVWFDEHKTCLYFYFPGLINTDVGNLSDRFKIKASAPHNFSWYLRNVFPSLDCPVFDSFAWGPLTNLGTGLCVNGGSSNDLISAKCSNSDRGQKLYWSKLFHFRLPNYIWIPDTKPLLDQTYQLKKGSYLEHFGKNDTSVWIHWKKGPLIELKTRLCLEATHQENSIVTLGRCNDPYTANQTWSFAHYTDEYERLLDRNSNDTRRPIREHLFRAMDASTHAHAQKARP